MKILVLGGAGYIGSHTVYELIDAGEEVVIIDNLETGHIEAVHPQAKFYKGDLRDKDFVDSVLDQEKDIDAVIHFAANSLVGESMVDPLKYYDNNLCGTKTMVQSLVEHGIRSYFLQQQQLMENQKRYRSWRQTAQNLPTLMERQNFLWKKCLNGLDALTDFVMYL